MCGNLDRVDPQRAYGWVWDDERPSEAKTIVISLNDQQVATCPSSQFRDDLAAAGIGAGRHSFAVAFSDRHLEDGVYKFVAKVVGSNYQLPGSPRDYVVSRDNPQPQDPHPEPSVPPACARAQAGKLLYGNALRSLMQEQKLFDDVWYGKKYKLSFENKSEALSHFVEEGMAEGKEPNALFDSKFYAKRYLSDDGPTNKAFAHYLSFGAEHDFWPSPLIDPTWVGPQLQKLGVADSVLGAVLHKSAALLIDPHPCFSVSFYLRQYPDVKRARSHPLVHYLAAGMKELRSPHPLFWPKWLHNKMRREDPTQSSLLSHLRDPVLAGNAPNPYFNVDEYRASAQLDEHVNAFEHYLRHWRESGATPNRKLDVAWARAQYKYQLQNLRMDPLSFLVWHYNGFLKSDANGACLAPDAVVAPDVDLRTESGGARVGGDRRRRIIYFTHNLKIQGAQTSLFELASAFSANARNDVVVLAPDDGPMKSRYEHKNIPVFKYKLPVNGVSDGKEYRKLVDHFLGQINDLQPDIIHCNTIQTYHSISLGGRLGVPRVWNIRESEEPDVHFQDLRQEARALAMEAFDSKAKFVFVSKTTENVWKTRFPQIESNVINNGVNGHNLIVSPRNVNRETVRAALGVKPDELIVLNVGTWTERKGQIDLVRALRELNRRLWRRIRVVLVGRSSGAYTDSLMTLIDLLPMGLKERVLVFDESRDDASRALAIGMFRAADMFVFTSRIESYPRVINEALFFGLPIITTPCFGVVEQIVPNIDGLFYEAGDVTGLAAHLGTLIVDAALRKQLGQAALSASQSRVMQFEDMVKQYSRIYEGMGSLSS